MEQIHSLRPHVTRDEAISEFQRGLGVRLFGRALRSVADVYLPYHLFRVEIANRTRRETARFAIDAVCGTLDLYRFDDDGDLDVVEMHDRTRNCVPASLDADAASRALTDAVRRLLFQRGVYRLHRPVLTLRREPVALHIPYYLGLYGNRNGSGPIARLRVLDAVRRRFEGAKARALFEAWLA